MVYIFVSEICSFSSFNVIYTKTSANLTNAGVMSKSLSVSQRASSAVEACGESELMIHNINTLILSKSTGKKSEMLSCLIDFMGPALSVWFDKVTHDKRNIIVMTGDSSLP